MTDEETEPLLPGSQTSQPQEPSRKKWNILGPVIASVVLLIAYFIVYFVYLPPRIQEAIDGNGSDIRHIHLLDVDPVRANVSIRIPVDPLPLAVNIQVGTMVLAAIDQNSTLSPRTPLGKFHFPKLTGQAGVDHLWVNDTIEIEEVNHGWISWFAKQTIRYGLQKKDFTL
jgi:hypothetical protein